MVFILVNDHSPASNSLACRELFRQSRNCHGVRACCMDHNAKEKHSMECEDFLEPIQEQEYDDDL